MFFRETQEYDGEDKNYFWLGVGGICGGVSQYRRIIRWREDDTYYDDVRSTDAHLICRSSRTKSKNTKILRRL